LANIIGSVSSLKGFHEGQTHIPTKPAPASKDTRLPGQDEYEKRPLGAQAQASQGPQAFDGEQRLKLPGLRDEIPSG